MDHSLVPGLHPSFANPEYTELEKQFIASAEPIEMTEETILTAAKTVTGLGDCGA